MGVIVLYVITFRAMLLNIPFHIFLTTLTVLGGMALYAYNVETGCDPYRSGQIKNANQVKSNYVVFKMAITSCVICHVLSNKIDWL